MTEPTSSKNLPAEQIKEAQDISSSMNTSLALYILSYPIAPLFFFSIPKAYKLAFRAKNLLSAAGDEINALEAETVYKQQKLKWNLLLLGIFGGIGIGILSWILPNNIGYYISMFYGVCGIVAIIYFIFADVTALKKRSAIKNAIDKIGG